jgi:hypothetical protein
MAGYNFSSLIPEPFIVTDTDGTRYEGKMAAAFGAVEYARCERLQGEFAAAWPVLQGAAAGDREAAAVTVEAVVRELVQLIVPTLPAPRLDQLPFTHRLALVEAWRSAQPAAAGDPKARASAPTTRGRRSHASSTPGTTPSRS